LENSHFGVGEDCGIFAGFCLRGKLNRIGPGQLYDAAMMKGELILET